MGSRNARLGGTDHAAHPQSRKLASPSATIGVPSVADAVTGEHERDSARRLKNLTGGSAARTLHGSTRERAIKAMRLPS